jgi:hypothetical protein
MTLGRDCTETCMQIILHAALSNSHHAMRCCHHSITLVATSADSISRHCDEWKYIIIGRIFESKIILIPPSLKISESSSMGAIVIRTRYDEGTESAEVATSVIEWWQQRIAWWELLNAACKIICIHVSAQSLPRVICPYTLSYTSVNVSVLILSRIPLSTSRSLHSLVYLCQRLGPYTLSYTSVNVSVLILSRIPLSTSRSLYSLVYLCQRLGPYTLSYTSVNVSVFTLSRIPLSTSRSLYSLVHDRSIRESIRSETLTEVYERV